MKISQFGRYGLLVIGGILLLLSLSLPAQTKVDPDALFLQARELAFSGEHQKARDLCSQILESYPDYYDARILLGRLFAWDKQFDAARRELLTVLTAKPDYLDARLAVVDVENWSGNYQSALRYLDEGLKSYPNREELLFKKAQLLVKLESESTAVIVLDRLLDLNPSHPEARSLYAQLREKGKVSKIGLNYTYDRFENTISEWAFGGLKQDRDPWHFASLDYSRRTRIGTVIGRLSYAYRFKKQGAQLELESYPKIRPGTYSYVGFGYSWTDLFPDYRFGAEIFQRLPRSFEASLGFRYISFPGSKVGVITGSVGKYYRNYWFNLRTYLTPKDVSFSRSFYFETRRYFANAENYLTLGIGYGNSPDDIYTQEEVDYLTTKKMGIGGQHSLGSLTILKWGIGLENDEWRKDLFLKRCSLSAGLSRRF